MTQLTPLKSNSSIGYQAITSDCIHISDDPLGIFLTRAEIAELARLFPVEDDATAG